jgi:hypothetical protein
VFSAAGPSRSAHRRAEKIGNCSNYLMFRFANRQVEDGATNAGQVYR